MDRVDDFHSKKFVMEITVLPAVICWSSRVRDTNKQKKVNKLTENCLSAENCSGTPGVYCNNNNIAQAASIKETTLQPSLQEELLWFPPSKTSPQDHYCPKL